MKLNHLKAFLYSFAGRVFTHDDFGNLIELDDDSFLQYVYSLYGA